MSKLKIKKRSEILNRSSNLFYVKGGVMKILKYKRRIYYNETMKLYGGCQKNVPVFKRFFYNHLCRNSAIRNIIMKSGIVGYFFLFLKIFLRPNPATAIKPEPNNSIVAGSGTGFTLILTIIS